MTDPTTDAAREALLRAIECGDLQIPEHMGWPRGGHGNCECSDCQRYRAEKVDTYAAAVSRARDEYHAKRLWEAVEAVLGGVGENASERFDYSAHLCMEATGVLPPGKDDPFPTLTDEQRLEVWRTFARTRRAILSALLARMDGAK